MRMSLPTFERTLFAALFAVFALWLVDCGDRGVEPFRKGMTRDRMFPLLAYWTMAEDGIPDSIVASFGPRRYEVKTVQGTTVYLAEISEGFWLTWRYGWRMVQNELAFSYPAGDEPRRKVLELFRNYGFIVKIDLQVSDSWGISAILDSTIPPLAFLISDYPLYRVFKELNERPDLFQDTKIISQGDRRDLDTEDLQEEAQWNLPKIMAQQAWGITRGSQSVLIGVIDPDGIYYYHVYHSTGDIGATSGSPVSGNFDVEAAWDHAGGDSGPWMEEAGSGGKTYYYTLQNEGCYFFDPAHGTACAGIIGAIADNNRGIAGIAGGTASTRGVRVTMHKARFWDYVDEIASAIRDLAYPSEPENKARVLSVSMSLTPDEWGNLTSGDRTRIEQVIDSARSANVLPVFSTGNDSCNSINYPTRLKGVIAVGAVNSDDSRRSTSNYGDSLDIVAPGTNIPTTDLFGEWGYNTSYVQDEELDPGRTAMECKEGYPPEHEPVRPFLNDYLKKHGFPAEAEDKNYMKSFSGTSAAVPHVAATLGLIISANANLSAEGAETVLLTTTDKVGGYGYTTSGKYGKWNNEMGYGRLNAYKAVLAAQTASRSIATSITWYAAPTPIYGSLTVPAGVTMTLADGASLSFASGKSLTVYGSLAFEGNSTLSFSGGGSLVLNTATTLGAGKTLTVSGANVTIATGASFAVGNSATLKLASGKSLAVYGTLTANGATFTEAVSGQRWAGIYARSDYDGEGQAVVQLTNCTVKKVNGDGVTGYTEYGGGFPESRKVLVKIDGGTYQDNTGHGVHLHYVHNDSYVRDATIQNNDGWGIYAYQSNHFIGGGTLTSSSITYNDLGGIKAVGGTPKIWYNRVHGNTTTGAVGVYLESVSSSSQIIYNNIFGNQVYDIKLYASSPTIGDNWLYSLAAEAEIYVTNGSYPDLTYGGNGIHTRTYDYPPWGPDGEADWAIEWGASNTASDIESAYNWWGNDSYVIEQYWNLILSTTSYFWSEGELDNPPRHSPATYGKPAHVAAEQLPPDITLLREGHQAERDGLTSAALDRYRTLVEQHPSSTVAHHALRRIYSLSLDSGAPREELDAYLSAQAARSLRPYSRFTAEELKRQILVRFGELPEAIREYRTLAEG